MIFFYHICGALLWTFHVTQRKVIMFCRSKDYRELPSLTALSLVTLPFTNESVSDSLIWLPDALTIWNHVIVSGPPFWACHVWLVMVGIMNNFMSLHFYEVEVKQVGWILRNVKNKARLITHSRLSLSSPTSLHRPWRELFMTVFYPIKLF